MAARYQRRSLAEARYVIQFLLLEYRHLGVIGRVARHENQERTLVLATAEDVAQEPHRAGRMRQCRQPGAVQRSDQEPGRDSNRLLNVEILFLASVRTDPPDLGKYHNQPRCDFKERLVLVRTQHRQRLEPFVGCSPVVEFVFLRLGRLADA